MKPNIERSKGAISLIWLVMIISVIAWLYDAYHSSVHGIYTQSGTIPRIVFFISTIFFLRWFRRAYYNLHCKFDSLSFLEGWTIVVWFIPIFNLMGPYQIMKEMFVKTREYLEEKGVERTHLASVRIVNIWWALWVFWIIHELVIYSPRFLSMMSIEILEIISIFFFILLSISTIILIKSYKKMEVLFHENQ